MHPIPCSHCGNNFMRQTTDPEAPKLCNNCVVREHIRNPTKDKFMEVVDILITCTRKEQIEIEEICINEGIGFTQYFLQMHHSNQEIIRSMKENVDKQLELRKKLDEKEHREKGGKWEEDDLDISECKNDKPKGKKK